MKKLPGMGRFISIYAVMLMLVGLFSATPHASADSRPTLKVGYIDVPNYISKGEDGYYSGFIYDYLEAISVYGGYRFEYVPGTPTDCIRRMMAGEIDLVAALPDIGNANPDMLLSERAITYAPVGVVLREGKSLGTGQRLRIGYAPGVYPHGDIAASLGEYGLSEGADYALIPYPVPGEMIAGYEGGGLDGYIDAAVFHGQRHPMAAYLFTRRFAVGMRKDRSEIRERIDRAAEKIIMVNPQLRDQLYSKYFHDGMPLLLEPEEKAYLAEHPVIRAAASPGQRPYSYFEDGEAKGVVSDIVRVMEEDLGIKFDFTETKNNSELMDILSSGKVDVVADCFANYNWGHEHNALLSFPYLRINYVPVMRRDASMDGTWTVAAPRGHLFTHEYVEKTYPADKLMYFDTIAECMKAVNEGRADVTFINAITVQHDIDRGEYLNLYTNGNVAFSHMVSFAAGKDADPRLVHILDKEINHIGSARVNDIVTRHTFEAERNRSLKAYIAQNPIPAIAAVAAALLAVIGGLVYVIKLRERSAEKLYDVAYHNSLTGIHNVRWFERNIPDLIRQHTEDWEAGRLFVMVLSTRRIDLLKASLNRKTVSDGIRRLVMRAREDNGWILAEGISSELTHLYVLGRLEDGMELRDAAEMYARSASMMKSHGYDVHMDYYFGLCAVPPGKEPDVTSLIVGADTAQSEAMENGDYIGIYDEKLQQKRLKQKEIEVLMNKALKNEEFKIWLQPKYDIRTHKIIGAEALARWQSPELGFVMPGLFISLFEKNGFIIEFDYYVLEHVCKLQRRRLDEGKSIVPFSVNQSGLHIKEPGYLDRLRGIMSRYDLPDGAIDLEITETAFVDFDTQEGRENSSAVIAGMKEMGFTVSMDDFCTGYSSIAMLQHLDMDVMKIDRAMLLASESSRRGQKIMRQVVALGQTLNMLVLCEGVETPEQEALLLENGCYYAQGFLFGKPMPSDDYFAFADSMSG